MMVEAAGEAVLVGTYAQDSDEWHAFRAGVVGSSDVAAVLGLSPYKSAYTLWHEKRGLVEPAPPSPQMKRKYAYGHYMEPFVARLFEEEHPDYALAITGSWTHQERTWQGCNPDRLLMWGGKVRSLVELKTFPRLDDWAAGPPPGYVAQLQWQLDTFGFEAGYLAGYANLSGDYAEHYIELNPFAAAATRDLVRAFFDSDSPPEIDGSDSTYQTLRALNPSLERGREVEVPDEIGVMFQEARAAYKDADAELLRAKGHLLAHMGTAQFATWRGEKIASRVARGQGVPYLKEQ